MSFFTKTPPPPPPPFNTYEDAIQFLFAQLPMYQQVGKIAYKSNLKTPEELDRYFGHPHKKFRSIHIAGTNGKGSVSHLIAAVLQTAGYKTGLYTSPHLKDFRERIKINGQAIAESEVLHFVNAHRPCLARTQPSFFEMTTALAFDCFARHGVDLAVVETGMGGRLDATNIIHPILSIITNIGLDHTEHLGSTPALIAREKAGIIKPHVPVIVGEHLPETAQVFCEIARKKRAPLRFAGNYVQAMPEYVHDNRQHFLLKFTDTPTAAMRVAIDLLGKYQQENVQTAVAALDTLRHARTAPLHIRMDSLIEGLAHAAQLTGLRGRWEIIGHEPLTICDTGHNAHGLHHAFEQLAALPKEQLHIVMGVVNDKDLSSILPLMPRQARYYFTRAAIPRALPAEALAAQCRAAGLTGEVVPCVREALALARERAGKDDVIFVGGSTFVVAEVLDL
jgi:dihydrofolate synthase/folylpolyglutamate synthase